MLYSLKIEKWASSLYSLASLQCPGGKSLLNFSSPEFQKIRKIDANLCSLHVHTKQFEYVMVFLLFLLHYNTRNLVIAGIHSTETTGTSKQTKARYGTLGSNLAYPRQSQKWKLLLYSKSSVCTILISNWNLHHWWLLIKQRYIVTTSSSVTFTSDFHVFLLCAVRTAEVFLSYKIYQVLRYHPE